MCYNAGHDTEKIQRAAKRMPWQDITHGFRHVATWIGLHPLRREPEEASRPIPYRRMCLATCAEPEVRPGFLPNLYGKVADIPEVDYIHLDYIRYVDVILAADFGKIRIGGRGISYGGLVFTVTNAKKKVADFQGPLPHYRHQIRRGSFQMRGMGAVPLRLDHEIGKPHRRRGSRQRQESERRRIPGAGLSR